MVVNMYLHSNGREVWIETLDGNSHKFNIASFYDPKIFKNKNWIDFYIQNKQHYFFVPIKANYYYFDGTLLDIILNWEYIDTLNVIERKYEH